MVRARARRQGARRRDRRRSRGAAAARRRLHRRHRRSRSGHAARCHLARRRTAVRGRELRRRHLQDRRTPFRGHPQGGRPDGTRRATARRDRGQRLRGRARRRGRAPARPYARALLHRGRVGPRAARGSRARRRARAEVDRRQGTEVPEVVAIIVDKNTRLLVQGLTGSEGRFHGLRNRNYGTNVVAGVTPGKAGQDVEGIPIFNTVADAVQETQANTTLIFVPARFATDAVYEAVDAGIETVICITEHIPAHEMLRVYTYLRGKGVTMIGPNCPGVLSPGKANVGIIPAEIFSEGLIGLVSRSGTLTYQIGHELTQLGLGNSTIVGIGGDPVVGSSFIDVLEKFEADGETELIVLVGEIGGDEEEKAAQYIADSMSKPVFAYIAGFSAPPGKTMGHAGAIISGSSGTAQAKKEALEAVGIQVGTTPTEVAQLVAGRFGARA